MEMRGDEDVVIREARADDAAALAMLATELGYPAGEAAMRRRMERLAAQPPHRMVVAERGGRVVAFAGMTVDWTPTSDDPVARLTALVVEAGERGRGTGAAIVAEAEEWARGRGAKSIRLTTAAHREGAHRFYERIGYAMTGLRYAKTLG
jgi:GNAT superfamily N-acetyltransferase